jgi:hypothetical protein
MSCQAESGAEPFKPGAKPFKRFKPFNPFKSSHPDLKLWKSSCAMQTYGKSDARSEGSRAFKEVCVMTGEFFELESELDSKEGRGVANLLRP